MRSIPRVTRKGAVTSKAIFEFLQVSPCIMCVQYRGGAQYRGGCSVPWGYLEYRGGVQYRGDIMINVGDILSTVGVFSTVGGYFEYRGGCSVPWGIS